MAYLVLAFIALVAISLLLKSKNRTFRQTIQAELNAQKKGWSIFITMLKATSFIMVIFLLFFIVYSILDIGGALLWQMIIMD